MKLEKSVHDRVGHLLLGPRFNLRHTVCVLKLRQGYDYDEEPQIGRLYPVELLNGYSTVTELERDEDGNWPRVEVECTAGCMPVPPNGDFDSDPDTWELPTQRFWLTGEEWREALGRGRPLF